MTLLIAVATFKAAAENLVGAELRQGGGSETVEGSIDGITPLVRKLVRYKVRTKAYRPLPVRTLTSTVNICLAWSHCCFVFMVRSFFVLFQPHVGTDFFFFFFF